MTTNSPPAIRQMRFDHIDALRGLAALMGVFHHSWVWGSRYLWLQVGLFDHHFYLSKLFDYGYIGVDLFLVLSGFCLSWPFISNRDRPFIARIYVAKRIKRIFPAYIIAFFFLVLLGFVFRATGSVALSHVPLAERLSPMKILAAVTLQGHYLNASFWSLVLEFRWYVLFPFVVLLARRYSAWPLLPLTLLLSWMPFSRHIPPLIIIYLPTFVAGVIAAEVWARHDYPIHQMLSKASPAGALLFLLLCFFMLPDGLSPDRRTIWEVFPTTGLFFFLTLLALRHEGETPWLVRALRGVGIFSYSLYLVHQPIIETTSALVHTAHWHPALQFIFWQVFVASLLISIGYFFYLVAEKPFLEGRSLMPPGIIHFPALVLNRIGKSSIPSVDNSKSNRSG